MTRQEILNELGIIRLMPSKVANEELSKEDVVLFHKITEHMQKAGREAKKEE